MDDDQQFCLRWNNHQSTLVSVFDTLLEKGMHVDCTLAAEGQTLRAHKVVLSACSPYFESVLSQQYDKHPIIILKDVKYAELRAMMDYMYRGEVNISQDQLAALLKAAESLQIKGLSDNKPSRPPSRPAPLAPRAPSPPPQTCDGSVDSREGSLSPTRRRKKARRLSLEMPTVPQPLPITTDNTTQGNADETQCKKEDVSKEGVEDLTIDEEVDDQPSMTHNDVVRNFQWHMERSQDEIMNSSDSVRDSQGATTPGNYIVTRSKVFNEEPSGATTLAVLKTVSAKTLLMEDTKENKKQPAAKVAKLSASNKTNPGKAPASKQSPVPEDTKTPDIKKQPPAIKSSPDSIVAPESPYNILPRADGAVALPETRLKEKGHKCPNCHRAYNARKNMVRHMTLECGREPQYKCPYCAYCKHRRNELRRHIEKKHPDKLQKETVLDLN